MIWFQAQKYWERKKQENNFFPALFQKLKEISWKEIGMVSEADSDNFQLLVELWNIMLNIYEFIGLVVETLCLVNVVAGIL